MSEACLEYEQDEAHPNRRTDAFGRWYLSPSGVWCSDITSITGWLEKPSIDRWKAWVGEREAERIGKASRERGKAMHKALEAFCKGTQCEQTASEGAVLASKFFPIIEKHMGEILANELVVYSDSLRVMGRLDTLAVWRGQLSVIDFKSSNKPKKRAAVSTHFLQTTFYRIAAKEQRNLEANQIAVLIANHENEPQEFVADGLKYEAKLRQVVSKLQACLPSKHFSF